MYGYEADPDKRLDLLQEIHVALWRSFKTFENRCSLRTWIYCIAHNTAVAYIARQRRANPKDLISLEDLDSGAELREETEHREQRLALDSLIQLIHRMKPIDRELMLLYLEDMDAASIGEIMGMSTNNVRVQIHRIKKVLSRRLHAGGRPR